MTKNRAWGLEKLEDRLLLAADFRSTDGTGNNLDNPLWGAVDQRLLRRCTVEYADGVSEPAGGQDGSGRPNPRQISNLVSAQESDITNDRGLTGFVFQWGQFLDHDIALTRDARPVDEFNIEVPADDPDLDPSMPITLHRAGYDSDTGTGTGIPRQQINQLSAYIDASNVYGSDDARADALRTRIGGRLDTGEGDLLPWNVADLENAAPPPSNFDEYFLAGDIRANEQPALTAMHTLFVREHNRLASQIAARDFPAADLSIPEIDEAIYQRARAIVGAEMQVITYREFLPALLGPDGLDSYTDYHETVNPSLSNVFSAALYRVGHTMLPAELLRLDADGNVIPAGNVALADAFFQPALIADYGIEPYLAGLGAQLIQEIDAHLVDDVRNMLFAPPAQFDLAAINIQRGRDHGLPDYNQVRVDLGLSPVRRFQQITSDVATRRALRRAYEGDIHNIDVWLGAISERHLRGASVGELIHTGLVDQFTRLRDGDRYYYENVFTDQELRELENTRLADVILRNTSLTEIQDEVFRSESVLVFRPDAGTGPVDVRVEVSPAQQVQVVDNTNDQVLSSQDLSETTQVVVFGTRYDDRIVIDDSWGRHHQAIEVHGQAGTDLLVVQGTSGRDRMVVEPTVVTRDIRFASPSAVATTTERGLPTRSANGHRGQLDVYYGNIEQVSVQAGEGNDFVRVRGDNPAQVLVDGGPGRDVILGSAGAEVLLGGPGRDFLFSGGGRDVMIGGRGRDVLVAGRGEQLLVPGYTAHDPHTAALLAILAEWNSPRDFESRVANLSGTGDGERLNGDHFLTVDPVDATVFDDGLRNFVVGRWRGDWRL